MNAYSAPLRDLRFALHDVLELPALYARLPGSQDVTAELVDAVLEEGARFVEEVLAPLHQSADAEGCL